MAALAPVSSRRVASYSTGWISLGAQIIFTTSACFAAGLQLQALIILNNPGYVPERWHAMLLVWAVLAYSAAVNIYGPKLLPHLNLASGVVHIAGFAAVVVVLGVMSTKASAAFVFVEVTNSSGWASPGASWLIGLISAIYPFLGYVTSRYSQGEESSFFVFLSSYTYKRLAESKKKKKGKEY